jgi:hypothetical protein
MNGVLWAAVVCAGLDLMVPIGLGLLDRRRRSGPYGFDALVEAFMAFGLLALLAVTLAIVGTLLEFLS